MISPLLTPLLSTYLVSQLAREHVTVALTGDGGDEIFAGYERIVAARLAEGYGHLPQFVRAALATLFNKFPESTQYISFVRQVYRFVTYA
jgi:asparagine synthase (glutamine-hydrolysing)